MGKQINGLAALVINVLEQAPFSDCLFVFCNHARDKRKILFWQRNGFRLWYRRLERERFRWPRSAQASGAIAVSARELSWLLDGLDISRLEGHRKAQIWLHDRARREAHAPDGSDEGRDLPRPRIHVDETRLQVLKEPGREASQQFYMWVYRGGPPERSIIWLQYAETRRGEAYALGLWPQLTTFLDDGHIPNDNNVVENAIRPFVIGRKGWLFAGSPRGAHASATLYSLIETAKANELEPRANLIFLLEHLPEARTPGAISSLVPQILKAEDLKR